MEMTYLQIKKQILVLLIIMTLSMSTYQIAEVQALSTPNSAEPGSPDADTLDISNDYVTHSNWEYPDYGTEDGRMVGIELDVDAAIADYGYTTTFGKMVLPLSGDFGDDCRHIPALDHPFACNVKGGDERIYFSYNSVFSTVSAEIVQQYVPYFKLHAEEWYSHDLSITYQSGISSDATITTDYSGSIGGDIGPVKVKVTGTASNSHSIQTKRLDSTTHSFTATGETNYFYYEAMFLRVFGSFSTTVKMFKQSTENQNIFISMGEQTFWNQEYDVPFMLHADLSNIKDTTVRYGQFPDAGVYDLEPENSGIQYYDNLYDVNFKSTEKISETNKYSYSVKFDGKYKIISGSIKMSESGSTTEETTLVVSHTFKSIGGNDVPCHYSIHHASPFESNLDRACYVTDYGSLSSSSTTVSLNDIEWYQAGGDDVDVFLYKVSSADAEETTNLVNSWSATYNDGTHMNSYSSTIIADGYYRFMISIGGIESWVPGALDIDETNPELTVISPSGNIVGGVVTFSATAIDAAGIDRITGHVYRIETEYAFGPCDENDPDGPLCLYPVETTHVIYASAVSYSNHLQFTWDTTNEDQSLRYRYEFKAWDNNGNAKTFTSVVDLDNQSPSQVTGLSAVATGQHSISISWNTVSDNSGISHYNIYRNGEILSTIIGTYFENTGLSSGTTYSYRVSAVDILGNEGSLSTSVSVTTASPPPPPPPPCTGSVCLDP